MKKIVVLLMICIALLAGCSDDTPSTNIPPLTNDNTPSVNSSDPAVTDNSEIPQDVTESTNHSDVAVQAPIGDVVEIREKMFIAQTNDIYFNAEDYIGKTIKYEGIFDIYEVPEIGGVYYAVIRYGPGCCGVDANAGFEVKWDGEYPNRNDWVEVVGVLEEYEENGYKYLRLVLNSLTVLPMRGAEYVNQ
jgi:Predicted membrane protein